MTGSAQRREKIQAVDDLIAQQSNTLIVGSLDRWQAEGRLTDELDEFYFAELASLTGEFLNAIRPQIVLSPLFADNFDASDVAQTLHMLNFEGRYRVITGRLPNTGMIKAEVANIAPALDFDILVVPTK